jgi:hypothetical protein
MVLALQCLGSGHAGAGIIGAMLGILPDAFHSKWSVLEEAIGKTQVLLGNDILSENIEREKELSKQDKYGRYLFCVSIDGGWNNRGSGRAYNSDSGHHITVGNRSGLVVALHYMSKRCSKCEMETKTGKRNLHDPNVCARNYEGSSKGMEAHGALKSCLNLHRNHNIVYEIIVMDDDSSTENILTWNFEEAIKEGMMTKAPLTAKGNKKSDNGQLPTTHPKITRLADHNHRCRCWAGKCYNHAYAKGEKSECKAADAERLKRNLTYALHQYKGEDFETFKQMIWAVLYHHFNVHDTCGDWCRYLQNKENPEELKKLFYRCKLKNAKLYEQLLEIWKTYGSDASLRQVHHAWHTNKCESMNQFIAKFIRKSEHLCRTIVGRARTNLAVSIDSVGYEEYYRTLFPLLNLDYDETILNTHHVRLDKQKIRKKHWSNLPAVRRRSAAARALRIRENFRKLIEDKKKGKSYKSGMNDPSKGEETGTGDTETGTGDTKRKRQCKSCGKIGHTMRSHRDCTNSTYKPKNKQGKFNQMSVTPSK